MKIIKAQTFRAEATVGLKRAYKNELISVEEFKKKLVGVQKKTFAEMNLEQKSEIGHRGRAIRQLIDYLSKR